MEDFNNLVPVTETTINGKGHIRTTLIKFFESIKKGNYLAYLINFSRQIAITQASREITEL